MTGNKARQLADELGIIKAQIADLQVREADLKADLVDYARATSQLESGRPAIIDGDLYRVSVSESERTQVDWRAIAERCDPSHQLVAAHSSCRASITVRVSGRTNDRRAAA